MGEYDEIADAVSPEKVAELAEQIELQALRNTKTREQAIEHGAALGASEADRRGETGQSREGRIARAKAYAAWEWDGKPEGGAHLVEFGVSQPKTYLPAWLGADTKPEKRK